MIIDTKTLGVQLYADGFFGNHLRQWDTIEELERATPVPHMIMLRQRGAAGGGVCVPSIATSDARDVANSYSHHDNLYFSEQLPGQPESVIFQCEYMIGEYEYMWFSTMKAFHREAMAHGRGYSGVGCRLILQQFLDLPSYENVMTLASCFPDHVLEITTLNQPCGNLGHNSIVWEVRKY